MEKKIIDIALVGDREVGISGFIHRYRGNICFPSILYLHRYAFVSDANLDTDVDPYDRSQIIRMWEWKIDAPQEERKAVYPSMDGYLILFDITSYRSLESLPDWIEEIGEGIRKKPVLYLGNKADFRESGEAVVSLDEIHDHLGKLEQHFGMEAEYVETSALTGQNVYKAVNTLIERIDPSKVSDTVPGLEVTNLNRSSQKQKYS